ncbi:hypothetical protein COV93_00075, partial [Candidatus Woesearchaeota archaeon CG11_big_fil_rev_8_21_14_0_20_43_8]
MKKRGGFEKKGWILLVLAMLVLVTLPPFEARPLTETASDFFGSLFNTVFFIAEDIGGKIIHFFARPDIAGRAIDGEKMVIPESGEQGNGSGIMPTGVIKEKTNVTLKNNKTVEKMVVNKTHSVPQQDINTTIQTENVSSIDEDLPEVVDQNLTLPLNLTGVNETGLNTTEPVVNVTVPEVNVTEVNATEPEVNVTEPELNITEPAIINTTADVNLTESIENVTQNITAPILNVTEPVVNVTEPEVNVTEPEVNVTEPELNITEPAIINTTVDVNLTESIENITQNITAPILNVTEPVVNTTGSVDFTLVIIGNYTAGNTIYLTLDKEGIYPEYIVRFNNIDYTLERASYTIPEKGEYHVEARFVYDGKQYSLVDSFTAKEGESNESDLPGIIDGKIDFGDDIIPDEPKTINFSSAEDGMYLRWHAFIQGPIDVPLPDDAFNISVLVRDEALYQLSTTEVFTEIDLDVYVDGTPQRISTYNTKNETIKKSASPITGFVVDQQAGNGLLTRMIDSIMAWLSRWSITGYVVYEDGLFIQLGDSYYYVEYMTQNPDYKAPVTTALNATVENQTDVIETNITIENETSVIETNATIENASSIVEINATNTTTPMMIENKTLLWNITNATASLIQKINQTSNETLINQTVVLRTLVGAESDRGMIVDAQVSRIPINGSETKQAQAIIGQLVKWTQNITLNQTTANLTLKLPKAAKNISIKNYVPAITETYNITTLRWINRTRDDGSNMTELINQTISEMIRETKNSTWESIAQDNMTDDKKLIASIDKKEEADMTEITIDGPVDAIELEYYTEAPRAIETIVSPQKRLITITSETHYENILAYVSVPDVPPDKISLYWLVNGTRQKIDPTLIDSNANGNADIVQWVVLHLSDQDYELIIEVTDALHLDETYGFISNVYDEVHEQDSLWSEPIMHGEYVRVTFERELSDGNDITIYARNNQSRNTTVEVYLANTTQKIAEFPIIVDESRYKVFLNGTGGPHDSFDLKIWNLDYASDSFLEFDQIIDPPYEVLLSSTAQSQTNYVNYTKISALLVDGSTPVTDATCLLYHNAMGAWKYQGKLLYNATDEYSYIGVADGKYFPQHVPNMPYGSYSYNVTCDYGSGNVSAVSTISLSAYPTSIAVSNNNTNPEETESVRFYANYSSDDHLFGGTGLNGYEIGDVIWEIDNTGQFYRGGIGTVDLDNDGKKDEIIFTDYLSIYAFNQTGEPERWVIDDMYEYSYDLAVGDMDGDGFQDDFATINIGYGDNGDMKIFDQDGTILYNGANTTMVVNTVEAKDVDHDGIIDFIAIGYGENPEEGEVWFYNGSGTHWTRRWTTSFSENFRELDF